MPVDAANAVRQALADAGAGRIGNYDSCSFSSRGTGRFRPLEGANPTVGSVGQIEAVEEERIEVGFQESNKVAILKALKKSHPYEEPAYYVLELSTT